MSNLKTKPDAWKKAGITEQILEYCSEQVRYVVNENQETYWKKCYDFLFDIKKLMYSQLTVKQRNWILHIKSQLIEQGYKL